MEDWTCTLCGGTIGPSEPVLVLEGHDARWTARSREPQALDTRAVFHEDCVPLPWRRSSS